MVFNDEDLIRDNEINVGDKEEEDSADEVDELETQLDDMYQSYQQRRSERDANYRAKIARGDADDEAWDGIKLDQSDEEEAKDYEMEEDSESDSDDDDHIKQLVNEKRKKDELSKNAKVFFASDSIFNDLGDDELLKEMAPKEEAPVNKIEEVDSSDEESKDDSDFEIVPAEEEGMSEVDSDSEDEEHVSRAKEFAKAKDHQQKVDLATVEAMTLAHQVALGHKNKNDLINEGINKYSFRDQDELPEWFIDDEKKHSKINKPITKEAALAIKEKQKQLNARPIKKVLEAQGRKKMRALRRLEKLKKKSDLINEDGGKSERDKAEEIEKLMKKLTKKQQHKPKTTLVVAKGGNRGLSGRPKGVKGKYKMVDGVMKNEQRALKRIAKKHKK
ncbi:AdoMet-dependent rRNA methyltransferase spb1 [Cerrena zonata]|uniref:AdoMet-dependent rRNA methyltransferase spb1 n=1 Tax=Cerrena zonata TaxID=2478898 RepID=A0AAW0FCX0_9APHY